MAADITRVALGYRLKTQVAYETSEGTRPRQQIGYMQNRNAIDKGLRQEVG